MENEKKYLKEEIRKEFRLERMILFSDAVFAIVITLMAIEIHLPEFDGKLTTEILNKQMLHLIPSVVAYAGSFLFIGKTWYNHLKIFSLLKDYDGKLVFRNMLLLFFIGLFPFSASLVAKASPSIYLTAAIYFMVILVCGICQLRLQRYILIDRPDLRINCDIHEELLSYKISRMVNILLCCVFVLISLTFYLIHDPELQPIAWWWFFPFPLVLNYFKKRIKRNSLPASALPVMEEENPN